MATDLEIARAATMRPIAEIGAKLGIPADALEPYGRFKAKIGLDFVRSVQDRKDGALVLVTGISPTPAGGRGQDHYARRAWRRAEPYRHQRGDLPARAEPRAEFWHEGRRGRRRA